MGDRPHLSAQARSDAATVIGLIIGVIAIGLAAGILARFLIPGRKNITLIETIAIGVVGSFVGGFLGHLLFQGDSTDVLFLLPGLLGSSLGAIIVLVVYTGIVGREAAHRGPMRRGRAHD